VEAGVSRREIGLVIVDFIVTSIAAATIRIESGIYSSEPAIRPTRLRSRGWRRSLGAAILLLIFHLDFGLVICLCFLYRLWHHG
jgi:hypothetical protein